MKAPYPSAWMSLSARVGVHLVTKVDSLTDALCYRLCAHTSSSVVPSLNLEVFFGQWLEEGRKCWSRSKKVVAFNSFFVSLIALSNQNEPFSTSYTSSKIWNDTNEVWDCLEQNCEAALTIASTASKNSSLVFPFKQLFSSFESAIWQPNFNASSIVECTTESLAAHGANAEPLISIVCAKRSKSLGGLTKFSATC